MGYETVLVDLDHTLFDSDESERLAFLHATEKAGLVDAARHFATYIAINREMWAAVERGELQPSEVRHRRFERFVAEVGFDGDPYSMAENFVWGLGAYGELYDGADHVLAFVAARASLALVTNGLSDVQRSRLSRLGLTDYFDAIVISSEVGATKPRSTIFEITFERLGNPAKATAVMVGDSLTSDIAGGRGFGIDTCWYNPHGRRPRVGDVFTTEVARLDDIPRALGLAT